MMPITFKNFFIRLFNRLTRWILNPIEILRISRQYKSDENYILNDNVANCFADRKDMSGDDTEILNRIITGYQIASKDIATKSEIFRPSNEWLPIYKFYLKEAMQALKDGNVKKLDKIYRNFWREPCSTGLVGLPVNMHDCYFGVKNITYINKLLYLNDSIHRFNLWTKLLGHRFNIDSLTSPLVGNPYGYFIDNTFIKSGADYQHYYATRINDILRDEKGRKVVVEIGAGFGGMAYYLIRDSVNTTYIDFDLPENLALTSYYLLKAFPEKRILLYNEAKFEDVNLLDYDIILMPNFELDKLQDESCSLIFNSYSLAEMSRETINHYIKKSTSSIKNQGWFFHVNHIKNCLVSAKDFPIPKNYSLISEEFAGWNLGRNKKMDEYEFLYKKNSV